jgi:hypothetical protein
LAINALTRKNQGQAAVLIAVVLAGSAASPATAATFTQAFAFGGDPGGTVVRAAISQDASGGSILGVVNFTDTVSDTSSAFRTLTLPGFTVPNARLLGIDWSFVVGFDSTSQASAVCLPVVGVSCNATGRSVVEGGYGIEVPGSRFAADEVLGPPGGPSSGPGGGGSIFAIGGDVVRTFEHTTNVRGSSVVNCIFTGGGCGTAGSASADATHVFSIADRWFDAYLTDAIEFSLSAAVRQTLSARCTLSIAVVSQCSADGSASSSVTLLEAMVFYTYEVTGLIEPGVGTDTGSGLGGGVPATGPGTLVPLPAPGLLLLSGLALLARRGVRSTRVA